MDGKEINLVQEGDTDAGFVITLDVLGDNRPWATLSAKDMPELKALIQSDAADIEAPVDGVIRRIIRGKIELFTKAGERIA